MKKGNFTTVALLGALLTIPAYAEKVRFEQLPANIQERIRAQTGSAQIEDIDRQVHNGKIIYEVAFKRNGQHTELVIEDTGERVAASSAPLDSRKITRDELPVPVKRVVDSRLQGMEVNDIEREVKNGQVIYGIGYKQAGGAGAQQELVLAQDGRVLRSSNGSLPAVSPSIGSSPGIRSSTPTTVRVMPFNDLPGNIRRVAEANLRDGHVQRAERQMKNGEIIYQLDFRQDDGRSRQLVVSEDGRVLRHEFKPTSAVGAPGTVQSGTSIQK